MICNSCGKQNPENSSFCLGCGAPLKTVDLQKPAENAAVPPVPPQGAPVPPPPPQQGAYNPPPANALKAGAQNDSKAKIFNIIAIVIALGGLLFAFYYLITNFAMVIRLISVLKDRLDAVSRINKNASNVKSNIIFKSGLAVSIVTYALRTLVALASIIGFGTVVIGKGVKASVIVPLLTIFTSLAYIISFEFFYNSKNNAYYFSYYYAKYTGHIICLTEFVAIIGAIALIIYIFSKSKIVGGIAAFLNGSALFVTFINFVRIVFKLVSFASDRGMKKEGLFGEKWVPEKIPASPTSIFNYLYGCFLANSGKGWTYNTLLMKLNLAGKKFDHPLDLVGFGAMFCVVGTLFALSIALLCSKGMAKKKKQ